MSDKLCILARKFRKINFHTKSQNIGNTIEELHYLTSFEYFNKQNIEQIEGEFDILTKTIQEKTLIADISLFLNDFYKLFPEDKTVAYKITSRIFLSSFIMYGSPEVTLDFSRKNIKNPEQNIDTINFDMYYFSEKLITILLDFLKSPYSDEKLRKFAKYMTIYSNIFYVFSKTDKIKQINKISNEWYQIKKTISDIKSKDEYNEKDRAEILEELKETKHKLVEMIHIISPSFDLQYLEEYYTHMKKYETMVHDAFWDIMRNKLNDVTGEYGADAVDNLIKEQLHEINDTLGQICTSKFQDHVDDIIVLSDKLNNDSTNEMYEKWFEYCGIYCKLITEIQSPARNSITTEKCHAIRYGTYDNINDLIINIFKFICGENEIVYRDIFNIRIMISTGSIGVFLKK